MGVNGDATGFHTQLAAHRDAINRLSRFLGDSRQDHRIGDAMASTRAAREKGRLS